MEIGDIRPVLPLARTDEARVDGARRAAESGDAVETAKQFETLFGVMLVRELRRSMPTGLFGDGPGADVYEGWFDEHLGRSLAERDALGLTDMVETTIRRAQAAREAMLAHEAAQEGT